MCGLGTSHTVRSPAPCSVQCGYHNNPLHNWGQHDELPSFLNEETEALLQSHKACKGEGERKCSLAESWAIQPQPQGITPMADSGKQDMDLCLSLLFGLCFLSLPRSGPISQRVTRADLHLAFQVSETLFHFHLGGVVLGQEPCKPGLQGI